MTGYREGGGGHAGLAKERATIELGCHGVRVGLVYEWPAVVASSMTTLPVRLDRRPRGAKRRTRMGVNRSDGQAGFPAYLAVWMNLTTPLPRPSRPKFHLTLL
jgi:hypothetical protein